MFTTQTIFILGAGASFHYGYPTGETLVKEILVKADELVRIISTFQREVSNRGFGGISVTNAVQLTPDFILERAGIDYSRDKEEIEEQKQSLSHTVYNKTIDLVLEECNELKSKIKYVDPPVIDHFLNRNQNLKDLGTLLIAWSLLEKEKLENSAKQKHGNWYRFVLQHLLAECEKPEDLLKNKVNFVTFNYDVSLERNLFQGLKKNHFFDGTDIPEQFFDQDRFIHIYGKIKDDPTDKVFDSNIGKNSYNKPLTLNKELLDPCFWASKGIKTIAPLQKIDEPKILEKATKLIEEAKYVYILGFGFDKENSRNIGLFDSLYSANIRLKPIKGHNYNKKVFFTNFGSKNVISKRASNIFFRELDGFLPPNTPIISNFENRYHYEMSTKNVYEAFADDFDFLE